jgi:hypothetical protein
MKRRPGCYVVYWSSNLNLTSHRLVSARGLITGVVLCLLAVGCAPTTQRIRVDDQATQAEARKQRQVALQAYMDDQRRLMRVSYPLLTKGSDLCGEDLRYTTGLALANSSTLLGEDFRESAQTSYQLTDEVKAVYVIPGSAADKAGIRSGDTIRFIGDWSLPVGQNAVRQSLEQLQVQTQTGKAVRLDVVRNGRGQSLLITPDKSCAYPVVLGDGDEVNAYADGKQVVIQRGMMRFATSDTELALVISHEIAHNSMSHVRSKMTNYALGTVVDLAAQILLGIPTQGLFGKLAGNAYSQDFESEADYVGLYIMAQSGGDIDNAPQFWRRMATLSPNAIKSSHLASHPATPERFVALEETVKEIKAKKAAGKPLVPNLKNAPDAETTPSITPEKTKASP